MLKHPAVPYVGPFAVFMLFLAAGDVFGLGQWEYPFRCIIVAAAIWYFSRDVLDLRPRHALASIALGVAVFLVWVAPDVLWPGYRNHQIFTIFGDIGSSVAPELRGNAMVLVFRAIRAAILVPILEELFWRGWLLRWLIQPDFQQVPLGQYKPGPFLIASALFAVEHGAYWEVGFLAGLAYNWWIVRTKSLADCILAHAVTNGVLSAYVVWGGNWQYW